MASPSSKPVRFLTGITTSGTPHLGNYVGSVRPSVRFSREAHVQSFYFLADYHALIKVDEPARIQRSTLEIAATWLACGLDPQRVTFYRQSDIPEIPELTWLLTCVTGKGLLNRAHAYKAQVDKNAARGEDPDTDVSAGLFMYPVLMGADILMFNAHKVPVGRDQIQHIEMARDMGQRFNHLYGEHFTLPEAEIDDAVATLPGLDGRKMSKSYDNTIPLFAPRAQLQKLIAGIVTDSRAPGEPKDTEGSALFQIYQAFADAEETEALRLAFAEGIAWSDAKQRLFERIDREIAPMRAQYEALVNDPAQIEKILLAGAEKARAISRPFMAELRHAVGLRNLAAAGRQGAARPKAAKAARPAFKQYREKDGLFYFKLLDESGSQLLQSLGFASPQEAGRAIGTLREQRGAALTLLAAQLEPIDNANMRAATDALEALAAEATGDTGDTSDQGRTPRDQQGPAEPVRTQ
ncbi:MULTISPECIES: tryptophan--tRNA ligase [unclassified Variovorax]|uniref:tryptophan--tRNA ligase n=1 Tax=unclassified Variovorax TaxID=663243 RepID=UPI00076DB93B|nr:MULTISPECIES: tryptophan--tRNA ligase [unclassified Variovorax]KWT83918.1 Tryptophanyl-tRNA synthetase [Variovorax sp. WDL1]PNG46599.1 Tryptophan--tRNA ligase [Variovorax sp. B2]PNG47579.1 Tryptophan--tRNA ligase [Variovorax sp. B4]VTV14374.1 Tryptophan--tRNA ligase [Variovorax sp. WDL1]